VSNPAVFHLVRYSDHETFTKSLIGYLVIRIPRVRNDDHRDSWFTLVWDYLIKEKEKEGYLKPNFLQIFSPLLVGSNSILTYGA